MNDNLIANNDEVDGDSNRLTEINRSSINPGDYDYKINPYTPLGTDLVEVDLALEEDLDFEKKEKPLADTDDSDIVEMD